MKRKLVVLFAILLFGSAISACGGGEDAAETAAVQPPAEGQTGVPLDPTPTLAPPAAAATPTIAPTNTPVPTATATAAPTKTPKPTDAPLPTETPTPSPTPIYEQVVEQGGYAFFPPVRYEMRRQTGQTIFTNEAGMMMLAGGADPSGGAAQTGGSMEQAVAGVMGAVNQSLGASLSAGAPFPVTIGGIQGQGVDLAGSAPQGQMIGRLITLRPAEGQLFYALGASQADMWNARGAADFERLLKDVRFIPMGSSFGCPRSLDPTYGFSPDNPIPIGGGEASQARELQYLEALLGPAGQFISYEPLGLQPFGEQMLSVYQLSFAQIAQPLMLYMDPNRYETPFAPAGFGCNGAFNLPAP